VISAKLAAAMGGKMWVDSEEGKGSKFSFTAEFQLAPDQEQRRHSVELDGFEVGNLWWADCLTDRVRAPDFLKGPPFTVRALTCPV
jgi:hypothetical protein